PLFAGHGVVPKGVTARFSAASSGASARRAGVLVGREVDGATTVAVVLEQQSADRVVPERQIALLEPAPAIDGAPLVVVVPAFFDPGTGRALVLRISLHPPEPGEAGQVAAFEHCVEDLRHIEALTESAGAVLDPSSARALAVNTALRALGQVPDPRSLLLFLAEDGSSPLAMDLAMS